MKQNAFRLNSITTCSPDFLIITARPFYNKKNQFICSAREKKIPLPVHVGWHTIMDNASNIGLIDAHTKRHSGYDNIYLIFDKLIEYFFPLIDSFSGMISTAFNTSML